METIKFSQWPHEDFAFREKRHIAFYGNSPTDVPQFDNFDGPPDSSELARHSTELTLEDKRFFVELKKLRDTEKEERKARRDTGEEEDLLTTFAKIKPEEITREALENYLLEKDRRNTTASDTILNNLCKNLKSNDIDVRQKADRRMQFYVTFLQERSKYFEQTKEKRDNMRTSIERNAGMEMTDKWLNPVKQGFNYYYKGFKNAKGSERAVMLGGLLVTLYALKKIFIDTKAGRRLLMAGALAAGGVATIEAIKSTYERSRYPTEAAWKEAMGPSQAKEMYNDFGKTVPPDFLSQIEEANKNSYCIINLSRLTGQQFEDLYWSCQEEKEIPADHVGYPHTPFSAEDEQHAQINDTERFNTLVEMADALGFVKDGHVAIPEGQKDETILNMILLWEKE